MGELNRRDLLKGVAAAGSALAFPALVSCSDTSTPTTPTTTAVATVTPTTADLERLQSLVKGTVVRPSDPRYDALRLIWNARYDDIRPQAVIEVADAEDVAAIVSFAREDGLGLRVRNGGHSFGGYSTTDQLVIDTRRLLDVQLTGDATSATLGSGFNTIVAYQALWPARRAIPAGTCPTVGIAGLATGGGLGAFGREYGLTCDALTSIEMVTADGRVVRADEDENADLFWAARGGGGGSFGVITSLTFDLLPVDMPFTHASYTFPWASASSVVETWQQWFPGSPRRTWSAVFLETQDPGAGGDPVVELDIVHAGDGDELAPIVGDLLASVGVSPLDSTSETSDFLPVESDFYCQGFQPGECELAEATAAGRIARPGFYASSNVATSAWSRDGLDVVVEWIERRQRDPGLTPEGFDPNRQVGKMIFEAADGAVNDVPADATAFVHRDALLVMQYQARWLPDDPQEVVDANIEWVSGLYEATAPYRSGSAYQNYIDPRLEDWERAYYGSNLDRLRSIKASVDPDDFFRFPQSIRPA